MLWRGKVILKVAPHTQSTQLLILFLFISSFFFSVELNLLFFTKKRKSVRLFRFFFFLVKTDPKLEVRERAVKRRIFDYFCEFFGRVC